MRIAGVVVLLLIAACALLSCHTATVPLRTAAQPISMAVLHGAGGIPPGWQFTPPPGDVAAGRRDFADLGCAQCHRVQGENFGATTGAGPELTGMGSHHPAAYFVESILNPDAVLVDGPGYIGADGHSTMPAYRDMTLAQLADVVTYVQSLRSPSPEHVHHRWAASSFVVQIEEMSGDDFDQLEDWFAGSGPAALNRMDGFVSLETYVTRTPAGRLLVSVYGFEDDAVLHQFLERVDADPAAVGRKRSDSPPLFRSPAVYKFVAMCVP